MLRSPKGNSGTLLVVLTISTNAAAPSSRGSATGLSCGRTLRVPREAELRRQSCAGGSPLSRLAAPGSRHSGSARPINNP